MALDPIYLPGIRQVIEGIARLVAYKGPGREDLPGKDVPRALQDLQLGFIAYQIAVARIHVDRRGQTGIGRACNMGAKGIPIHFPIFLEGEQDGGVADDLAAG